MTLTQLNLHGFKNYEERKFSFKGGITCIVGKNGAGKTNLLDGIYYLAFAKTALNATDTQNIHEGLKSFTVFGTFSDDCKVACGYEFRKGKTLKVDGNEQIKLSEHIGKVPLIFTTPDDSDIIREGSEYRRKFFDGAISQQDSDYLKNLISYNQLLRQRNEHLKSAENSSNINHDLLDTYDSQLLPRALAISRRREEFLENYLDYFSFNYSSLHAQDEVPKIAFDSEVTRGGFESKFKASRQKDILMTRTMMGPHRDKYDFLLNDHQVKKFASQGQQKTFIIALKLAEFDFLKASTSKTPLLLLDDIFDKLDDERIAALVDLLDDKGRFDQIFITDARAERSKTFLKNKEVNFIELS